MPSSMDEARQHERDAGGDGRAAAPWRIYDLLRVLALAGSCVLAIWLIGDVLMVVFAAVLLATILHGIARLLGRVLPLPYWACLLLVVAAIAAALAGLVALAGPGMVAQASALREALGQQAQNLHGRLTRTGWGQAVLQQVPQSLGGDKPADEGGHLPTGLARSVAGAVSSAFGLFGTLAVVVIAGLYLAASPATYVNGVLRLVPERHRPRAKHLAQAMGRALWMWSAGQALDMLVVGILSGLGLWVIGVPLAMVLGVVAALFNFVPYIGAIVGAVPAVILAFSVGEAAGLETIGLYLVIQGFEGNVMAPLIQKRAVDLPPGLTILSQTLFGAILGVPGLIFATPLTAAITAGAGVMTAPLREEDEV